MRTIHVADSDRRDVWLREEIRPVTSTAATASNDPDSDLIVGAENLGCTHIQGASRQSFGKQPSVR
jgi:hypothetical protein